MTISQTPDGKAYADMSAVELQSECYRLRRIQTAHVAALQAAKRLIDEALPKFNWGASALDANAIELLNTVPGQVTAALAEVVS